MLHVTKKAKIKACLSDEWDKRGILTISFSSINCYDIVGVCERAASVWTIIVPPIALACHLGDSENGSNISFWSQ
jgi:hypothetical protein